MVKKIPKAKGDKRVLVISDTHCGHLAGLTPPEYQYEYLDTSKTQRNKFAKQHKEMWQFFADVVNSLRPIDILLFNGDAIDGKGEKSGGTELLSADRAEQVNMAVQVIEFIDAKKIAMTYGTPYHGGKDEDWEAILADKVGATISGHDWVDVNGLIIDFKHKVGSSSIPHGQLTPLLKSQLWGDLWAIRKKQPMADVVIRSHVHYTYLVESAYKKAIITPALQGYGSKFGVRQCENTIDLGVIYLDVHSKKDFSCTKILLECESQVVHARKL
ncbi:MAG: hypothetical protein GY841_04330 [FCB group bacterium]|nr:hypothetical protein [FCB group bacterium]